jgi:general secretion pathway protein C
MELLFKKYFWMMNVALIGVAGFATSRAASSYVEYEVFKVPYVEEATGAEDEGDLDEDFAFRRPLALRSVDLERRRQLAEAARKPEEKPPEVVETVVETQPEVESELPEQPIGELDLDYVAAITTASDPSRNLALVRIDGGETKWVSVGDELKPGFTVAQISNYYISVSEGVTELLWKKGEKEEKKPKLAGGRGGPRPGDRKKAEKKKPEKKKKKNTSPYAEGVKQTGPWEYRIDRGMLNEQLQDLGKLGREARVIPNYDRESGSYKGFKLIGVRPNSLYRAIGIRSGDVIMQINGEELNSPGKALELFTKLQTSSAIQLDIGRRGQNHSLSYKIE